MRYIQYYNNGAVSGKLIEACSDRAVVIVDGRLKLDHVTVIAQCTNGHNRPQYDAFAIFEGDSFLRSKRVTDITKL